MAALVKLMTVTPLRGKDDAFYLDMYLLNLFSSSFLYFLGLILKNTVKGIGSMPSGLLHHCRKDFWHKL